MTAVFSHTNALVFVSDDEDIEPAIRRDDDIPDAVYPLEIAPLFLLVVSEGLTELDALFTAST